MSKQIESRQNINRIYIYIYRTTLNVKKRETVFGCRLIARIIKLIMSFFTFLFSKLIFRLKNLIKFTGLINWFND